MIQFSDNTAYVQQRKTHEINTQFSKCDTEGIQ